MQKMINKPTADPDANHHTTQTGLGGPCQLKYEFPRKAVHTQTWPASGITRNVQHPQIAVYQALASWNLPERSSKSPTSILSSG